MKRLLFCLVPLCGSLMLASCGGSGGGGPQAPTPTPTTAPTAAPTEPIPVPFDLRGRILVAGTGRAAVTVRAVGRAGAATATASTRSVAGGVYSFFLGAGTYDVSATVEGCTRTRVITVPPGGQTVDGVNLSFPGGACRD